MLLVLRKQLYGELTIGLLKAIAVVGEEILFGCETFLCNQALHNYYVSIRKISRLEVVKASKIADPHPLVRIGTPSSFAFSLHH